jgi:hypothetical protein
MTVKKMRALVWGHGLDFVTLKLPAQQKYLLLQALLKNTFILRCLFCKIQRPIMSSFKFKTAIVNILKITANP